MKTRAWLAGLLTVGLASCSAHEDRPSLTARPVASVFGVEIYATASTSSGTVRHVAAVLAQYLDNDEDGEPDDPAVVRALRDENAAMVLFHDEDEMGRADPGTLLPPGTELESLQAQWETETHPGGAARGVFDATLEEVLHLVTHVGYANAYPETFGERPGSAIAEAMDLARGGHFEDIPDRYPADAWYTYDDETCDYGCQIAEYLYWALTSLLGGQSFPGRADEIRHEWRLATPDDVRRGDPAIVAVLEDPRFRVPTGLPDGSYNGPEGTIRYEPR